LNISGKIPETSLPNKQINCKILLKNNIDSFFLLKIMKVDLAVCANSKKRGITNMNIWVK
jgi:hypothetical protein